MSCRWQDMCTPICSSMESVSIFEYFYSDVQPVPHTGEHPNINIETHILLELSYLEHLVPLPIRIFTSVQLLFSKSSYLMHVDLLHIYNTYMTFYFHFNT